MNKKDLVTDKMLMDIFGGNLMGNGLMKHDPEEFIVKNVESEGKLLNMPMSYYVYMATSKAIETHFKNLVVTYGKDAVVHHIAEVLARTDKE